MDQEKPLTKEERIAQRRARVAARMGTKEGVGASEEASPSEMEDSSPSKRQVAASRDRVDNAKEEAERALTELCAAADAEEAARRVEEERRAAARSERIERELGLSAEQHEVIRERWDAIADHKVPQELYGFMSDVQQDCLALVARKDALIKSLCAEVKEKDESYNDMLTAQADQITAMVARMRERYAGLVGSYAEELARVEEACEAERASALAEGKERVDGLFAQRRALELRIIESQRRREDEFQAELSQIRARDAEEYNKLKVSLEGNIQMLEQQLEEMRATYQLNTEKLDYNHRVLREMDTENKRTVKHHKQKLKRLQEALATVTARHEKQDTRFKQENSHLTDEYKRATEQFKDLQRKYRHFETVDSARYRELWAMNEESVLAVVGRVLQADSVIHERLLGIDWSPPPIPVRAAEQPPPPPPQQQQQQQSEKASASTAAAPAVGEGAASGEASGAAPAAEGPSAGPRGGSRFSRKQVRRVMDMLASDAEFLVDGRVRERLEGVPEDEKRMHLVDCVLVALGVVDGDGLDELVSVFYGGDEHAAEPVVHPNDVVGVLTSFVSDRQHLKKGGGGGGAASSSPAASPASSPPGSPVSSPDSGEAAVAGTVGSAKFLRNQRRQQERQYWVKLGEVLSGERHAVWDGLETALGKYTRLLADRSQLVDETTALSEQNAKLKGLLQQYLRSSVNQELEIPPTRLVRAGE